VVQTQRAGGAGTEMCILLVVVVGQRALFHLIATRYTKLAYYIHERKCISKLQKCCEVTAWTDG
jgi:hypothetical protein